MKHYEIRYFLKNQSTLFSNPQTVIAKSKEERDRILYKCDVNGYWVEQVTAFDPVEIEERFYA